MNTADPVGQADHGSGAACGHIYGFFQGDVQGLYRIAHCFAQGDGGSGEVAVVREVLVAFEPGIEFSPVVLLYLAADEQRVGDQPAVHREELRRIGPELLGFLARL